MCQVKFQNKYEIIKYELINEGADLDLVSNIELSELDIKNQNLIREYLPQTKDILNLKNHKIKLNYKNNILSLKVQEKLN